MIKTLLFNHESRYHLCHRIYGSTFFSARILVQWILSEKACKVLSPSIFWILSLAGAYALCLYGWLRHDFSIVLGQVISYYIYIWNLGKKGVWNKLYRIVKLILLLTPIAAFLFVLQDVGIVIDNFFKNEAIPLWLLLMGSAGQIIFTASIHISMVLFLSLP